MCTEDCIETIIPEQHQGIVVKKFTGIYHVHLDGRELVCTYSPGEKPTSQARGRKNGREKASDRADGHGDPVAIGDAVEVAVQPGETGRILAVLPRRNQLSRRSAVPKPGGYPYEQVIVANVDQVVPVFAAADPPPHWNMLDRYLVAADKAGIPAFICITKIDLASTDGTLEAVLDEYDRLGYPAVLTSSTDGSGIAAMKSALTGKTSVLVGKSGVGKTSLLNALEPGLGLRVNSVNTYTRKGRHTTTNLEMFPLIQGGALIDTPGVREFGIWDVETYELAGHFPEMRPFLGRCRFGLDCLHIEEPGCAVRKAVMGGHIPPRRYRSYVRLIEET